MHRFSSFPTLATSLALLAASGLLLPSCSKKPDRSKARQPSAEKHNTTSSNSSGSGGQAKPSRKTSAEASGTKTPTRALPRLSDSVLSAARDLIDAAKSDYNKAITENRKPKPDKNAFFRFLNLCKQKLDDADTKLEDVTMWEEDSTMNDWKVSADERSYLNVVMRQVARIDKLRSAAEKISRAR